MRALVSRYIHWRYIHWRHTHWVSGLFILTALAAATSHAQDFDAVEIKTEAVTDHIYMLTGRGGNIGVSTGPDGVFIIDDQYAPLSEKIKASIAQLDSGEVRFVINTHWHGDHTGGNENFGQTGANIIAHDRVRARLQQGGRGINIFELEPKASVADALPTLTYSEEMSLHLNGESVRIYHTPNGHTDGDSIVHFPASNVLHLGDLYFSTGYPFIDRDSGGSLQGVIRAIEFALQLSDENTRIIPGHGSLADKKDLQRYHQMLLNVRDAVQLHIDRGMDLKSTVAAKPTADWDKEWGEFFINGDQITATAWLSLSLDSGQHRQAPPRGRRRNRH